MTCNWCGRLFAECESEPCVSYVDSWENGSDVYRERIPFLRARIAALERVQQAAWAATALHAHVPADPLCASCGLVRALDSVEDNSTVTAQGVASVKENETNG